MAAATTAPAAPLHAPPVMRSTPVVGPKYGDGASTEPLHGTMEPLEAAAFDGVAEYMRTSPTGAKVLDRLIAEKARIEVDSADEWKARGFPAGVSAACVDGAIYIQRDFLVQPAARSLNALVLAHEGAHWIDDHDDVGSAWRAERQRRADELGAGAGTPEGLEYVQQADFELQVIKEARAYILQGTMTRELGIPPERAISAMSRFAASSETPDSPQVWADTTAAVVASDLYNPEHRSAAPANW